MLREYVGLKHGRLIFPHSPISSVILLVRGSACLNKHASNPSIQTLPECQDPALSQLILTTPKLCSLQPLGLCALAFHSFLSWSVLHTFTRHSFKTGFLTYLITLLKTFSPLWPLRAEHRGRAVAASQGIPVGSHLEVAHRRPTLPNKRSRRPPPTKYTGSHF